MTQSVWTKLKTWFPRKKTHNGDSADKENAADDRQKEAGIGTCRIFMLRTAVWLGIFIIVIALFFDQLLMFSLTYFGSKITGVEISMDDLETNWARGDVKIINLRVANPGGFTSQEMVKVASFYLALDKSSIFSGKLLIKNIEVNDTDFTGEISPDGKLNFLQVFDNLQEKFTFDGDSSSNDSDITIENANFSDITLTISDRRYNHNINGSGIHINKMNVIPVQGDFVMDDLKIIPPAGDRKNVLELDHAAVKIEPGTQFSSEPQIRMISASGLNVTAELHDNGKFNIHELISTINQLFFPGDKTGKLPEVHEFSFEKFSFKFHDDSPDSGIDGFTISFGNFSGNLHDNWMQLDGFAVTNPAGYDRNMMNMDSAYVEFAPQTADSGQTVISTLNINKLKASASIRNDNMINFIQPMRYLEKVFAPLLSQTDKSNKLQNKIPIPLIKNFELADFSLTVNDLRPVSKLNSFELDFEKLGGSIADGKLTVNKLFVYPVNYKQHIILGIGEAYMEIEPETIFQPRTTIKKLSLRNISGAAGIISENHTTLQEISGALNLLLLPMSGKNAAGTIKTGNTRLREKNSYFDMQCLDVTDCEFAIWDSRQENTSGNFKIKIGKLAYSIPEKNFILEKMYIKNPHRYHEQKDKQRKLYTMENLLTVKRIYSTFSAPEMHSDGLDIEHLNINGLNIHAEYRDDGKYFNMHEAADALCNIFAVPYSCDISANSTPAESAPSKKAAFKIRQFTIENSYFHILNQPLRPGIPHKLDVELKNIAFPASDSGENIIKSLHDKLMLLEQKCKDATNPILFLGKFLGNLPGNSVNVGTKFIETGTKSIKLVTEILNPFNWTL